MGFSKEQKKDLEEFKATYKESMVKEFGVVAEGLVHRHMLFVRKIGGALTAAKIFESGQSDVKDRCHCDPLAFQIALDYAHTSIFFVQEFLRSDNKSNQTLEDRDIFNSLESSFTTKDIKQFISMANPKASTSSLNKTADRKINEWTRKSLIEKVKHGHFKKAKT